MMILIIANGTAYNKYSNNNKINDCPITSNYIINYFNRNYPLNVFIYRDINHFIALFFNFSMLLFSSKNATPDRNGGVKYSIK